MRRTVRDEFLAQQRLLVIAPHPDDEILGCGGLLKRVKACGGETYVMYVTVGPSAQYDPTHGYTQVSQRRADIEAVVEYLGIDGYALELVGEEYHLNLNVVPERQLVDLIETRSAVSLAAVRPTMVAIPIANHFNQDHRVVFQAAFAALRPIPDALKPFQSIVLMYEQIDYGWSIDRLQPNLYIDISEHLDAKVHALSLHASQARTGLHVRAPDNIRRLAELRGREVGIEAAEAFVCHRFLI